MYTRLKTYLVVADLLLSALYSYSQPVISSFSPASGYPGSVVTITGNNFNPVPGGNIVYFGGAKAVVTAATPNSLSVIVPEGVTYRPISVTTNNLTAYSTNKFSLTFPGGGMLFSKEFFAPHEDYNAATSPYSVHLVDFDLDGKLDIVTVGRFNMVVLIYRNQCTSGTISFTPPVSYLLTGSSLSIPGDFDGDGKIDLAIARDFGLYDSVTILRNTSITGLISFVPAGNFSIPNQYTNGYAGDLDMDGRPELAFTSNRDTGVSVLRNMSIGINISFANKIRYLTMDNPQGITMNDLDNDGKPEIIVVSPGDPRIAGIGIFKNNCTPGTITLAPRVDYLSHGGLIALDGDMNGDLKPDLVVGHVGILGSQILLNTTTGMIMSFGDNIVDAGILLGAHLCDLNGDGKPDVSGGNYSDSSAYILRNMSTTPSILLPVKTTSYRAGGGPTGIAAGDLDGDGRPDLVVTNVFSSTISVLRSLAPACHLTISNFPYRENFETTDGYWFSGGDESDWEWGNPMKPLLNSAGGGTKCWMTGKTSGTYLRNQGSWLRSPCFDFSGLQKPEISFKVFWEAERRFDGANLQYSLDSGISWATVGKSNSNTTCTILNWYNESAIPSLNGQDGWSGATQSAPAGCARGGGSNKWLIAKHDLSFLAGEPKVIFRFWFGASSTCNDFDGFAIDDVRIGEPDLPKVFLGNDTTICASQRLILKPGAFASYVWQDNSTTSTYDVKQEGTYFVNVTDSFGCPGTDTIKVKMDCNGIYFVGAFTPNSDGLNDLFGPAGDINKITNYTMRIYGRWGQLVFTSTDPYKKWDGKNNGTDMDTQTLVWYAVYSFEGKTYTKKGTITLIR